jgi:hypothetical protein
MDASHSLAFLVSLAGTRGEKAREVPQLNQKIFFFFFLFAARLLKSHSREFIKARDS